MKLSKLLLATIGATVLLGALVSGASARSFSLSAQTMRATFRTVTFNGVFGNIVCEVQMEGSVHARTIAKVVGTLIGYITEARINRCSEQTATILRESLPWHVRYLGFSGILPNITDIRVNVINVAFQVREPAFTCLARSEAAHPAVGTFNRDVVTRTLTTAEISGTIPTSCGAEGSFRSDRANITTLNSTTRITVTLI